MHGVSAGTRSVLRSASGVMLAGHVVVPFLVVWGVWNAGRHNGFLAPPEGCHGQWELRSTTPEMDLLGVEGAWGRCDKTRSMTCVSNFPS